MISKNLPRCALFVPGLLVVSTAAIAEPAADRAAAQSAKGASQAATRLASPAPSKPSKYLTLVIGGDLGLGGSGQLVDPKGARKHGRRHAWKALTAGIAPLINGDVNFANLETVVTASNRLPAADKMFSFKSHPVGVRHLVKMGFNVFSLSNNHAIDYGAAGMRQTLTHIAALRAHGLRAAPGLGKTRKAAGGPQRFKVGRSTFSVSAIGIGGVRPTGRRPGIVSYRSTKDYRDTLAWLAAEKADYRILSVHYGRELDVRPRRSAVKKFRDQAVREAGIDLIVGHHAHVAAGVQSVDGKLVFYGMGNLLHPGMQNMARFNRCRDYGILAKLHLARGENGRLRAGAIELHVLQDMHLIARAMPSGKASKRLAVLNQLASGLDHRPSGATGVRFRARADGTGLACLPGAAALGGPVAELCREWAGLKRARVVPARTCATSIANLRPTLGAQRRKRKQRRLANRPPTRSVLQQVFGD